MHSWQVTVELGATLYAGHSYGVDESGRWIPSVTQLAHPSAGWAGCTSAMDRGSRMHQVLEEVAQSKRVCRSGCGSEDIQDDVYRLATQWRRKVHQPYAQVSTEQRFVCRLTRGAESYSYAGTVDLIETLGGKVVLVADWKSGAKHRWHRLQLGCYMHALGAMSGAIIYPDAVEWVSPLSSEEVVSMIQSYHARQAEVEAKKKWKASRWRVA